MSVLIDNINAVLDFCALNHDKKSIKCGSPLAIFATKHLEVISYQVLSLLKDVLGDHSVSISYGAGNFPKVPWVAITPKGMRVSNSDSVAIVFSERGLGIVAGAMTHSNKLSRKNSDTVKRSKEPEKYIILRAGNKKRDYNDKFYNPLDFFKNTFTEFDLINHLKDSLKLIDEKK
jgi:hypothetical protein